MLSLCQDIWVHLNQPALKPLPDRLASDESRFAFPVVAQYFAQQACAKTIDLRALSAEDEAYLANIHISPEHLRTNLKETLIRRHLDPLEFQLDAIKGNAVCAFCPFDGRRVKSSQSLLANINVLFYRFETRQVFYVATANMGSGFEKSALYFPEHELIVTAGDKWGLQQDDLVELKARVVCSAKACYEYLSDPNQENRKAAVCLGYYHFAHHLWNELSGLHRLYRRGLLQTVDKFLVLREPLGPVEQIFPEISKARIERKDNTGDLFNHILANRYFACRVGDSYVASDLAARVARVSSANCLPGLLESVKDAGSKHYPLLWVGIRVGNRAWTDQIEGLSNLIESLYRDFPKLGVVFDGFSLPADRTAQSNDQQGYTGILARENEVVDRIVETLQRRHVNAGMFNIIGHSIFEANVWAHAIDVYLSPYGSIQHKVGWFANKPGIIHTNRTLLQGPAEYVWAAVENGIPPRYVSLASVSDIHRETEERMAYNDINDASESGAGILAANKRVRGNPEFNDYSVRWEALYHDLADLIKSPRTKNTIMAVVFAKRAKHKLRMAIRTTVKLFD